MPVDDFPDRAARPAHAAGQTPWVFGGPPHGHDPLHHVPIRLDPELQRRLEARATADHTSPSDVVRRALHAYLDDA
jgi:hypothetical protein